MSIPRARILPAAFLALGAPDRPGDRMVGPQLLSPCRRRHFDGNREADLRGDSRAGQTGDGRGALPGGRGGDDVMVTGR